MARAPSRIGPFHGTMLRTTPAPCRTVMDRVPGLSVGIVSPWIWVARPAASRNSAAEPWTLNAAHRREAPTSAAITVQNSSSRLSSRSAAFSSTWRRWVGPLHFHSVNALAADSTAAKASAASTTSMVVMVSPVTGCWRSMVLLPATVLLSMMMSDFMRVFPRKRGMTRQAAMLERRTIGLIVVPFSLSAMAWLSWSKS